LLIFEKFWFMKKRRLARWRIYVNDLKLVLRNHSGSWRPYTTRSSRRQALLCIYVHIHLFVEKFQRRVGSRVLTIRSGSLCYMHDPILAKTYFCSLRVYNTCVCISLTRFLYVQNFRYDISFEICTESRTHLIRSYFSVSVRIMLSLRMFFLFLKTFQKADAILYAVRIDVYKEKRCCITALANSSLIKNNLVKSVTVLMKKLRDALL